MLIDQFKLFLEQWHHTRIELKQQMALNKERNITLWHERTSEEEYYNLRNTLPVSENNIAQIVIRILPNLIYGHTSIPEEQYKIVGSVGQGEISEVPWICIFDKSITTKAEKGFYIVYLFKPDMSGFYLSLMQGWTQYTKTYKPLALARNKIKQITNKLKALLQGTEGVNFGTITIGGNSPLIKGYELGNICSKYYDLNKLPTENEFLNDLQIFVGIYRELKRLVGSNPFEMTLKQTEDEYQADIQTGTEIVLPKGKIPKKNKRVAVVSWTYPRNKDYAAIALKKANYQCENIQSHQTFVSNKSKNQFMEAHHLIPMEFQDDFDSDLDVPENIICLCPNCHRSFHHSTKEYLTKLIKRFYSQRNEGLQYRDIIITEERLTKYYFSEIIA